MAIIIIIIIIFGGISKNTCRRVTKNISFYWSGLIG